MKRTLIVFILVLTFLLQGCGGNPKYYDTCKEALEEISPSFSVLDEICEIRFSDVLIVYAANTSFGQIVTADIKEKDGKFRVLDFTYTNGLANSTTEKIEIDRWSRAVTDDETDVLYQWIPTDSLPESRDERYQYKDCVVGENLRVTLVYYVLTRNEY